MNKEKKEAMEASIIVTDMAETIDISLKNIINDIFIAKITLLARVYGGGNLDIGVKEFIDWIAQISNMDEAKKELVGLGNLGIFELGNDEDLLKTIISKQLEPHPKYEGVVSLLGRESILVIAEERDIKDQIETVIQGNGTGSLMFSKDGSFYYVFQYKCDDCEMHHLGLWIVYDENSEDGKKFIKETQEKEQNN